MKATVRILVSIVLLLSGAALLPQGAAAQDANCGNVAQCAQAAVEAAREAKEIYQQAVGELKTEIAALQTKVDEQAASLASKGTGRVLAIAEIRGNAAAFVSEGATYTMDGIDGIFTFPNPLGVKFVTLVTDVALPSGFVTQTHIVVGNGPTFARIRSKAMDTGDRTFPPQNVNIAVLAFN